MRNSVVNLSVRLEAAFRREGGRWLAWCLPLDVITQADSKKAAFEALKEAVELWFESCIERGVLEEALAEVGFQPIKPGEKTLRDANLVGVKQPRRDMNEFNAPESFEVTIPAFIAAEQLEPSAAR